MSEITTTPASTWLAGHLAGLTESATPDEVIALDSSQPRRAPAISAPSDIGAESATSEIIIPPSLLAVSYGTPGGLDVHNNSVQVFKFRTTTGDEGCCTPTLTIPSHWATMEVAVEYINLSGATGDVRFRYEEGVPSDSAEMAALSTLGVVGVVDTAQPQGYRRTFTLITGRAIPAGRRVVMGIARTNSQAGDTLDGEVGITQITVRESS